MTWLAAAGFTAVGLVAGVQFGRWSLLLLRRWSWHRQDLRSLPRPVAPAVHAGEYVVPRSVSNGVETLENRQFRVR